MNTLEIAEAVPQQQYAEPKVSAGLDKSRARALVTPGHSRLRYALLLCIALMVAWLGYNFHASINSIESELDMIRANLLLPR